MRIILKIISLIAINVLLLTQYTLSQNLNSVDSLLKVIETDISLEEKMNLYLKIADTYSHTDSAKMVAYGNEAIKIGNQLNNMKAWALSHIHIASYNRSKGNIEFAKNLFNTVLDSSQKENFPLGMAYAYYHFADIEGDAGNREKALEIYDKALKGAQEAGERSFEGHCYNNIAIVYMYQGKYDTSIEYHKKALAIRKELKDEDGLLTTNHNIAIIYHYLGDFDKAEDYYKSAIKAGETIGAKRNLTHCYSNFGNLYRNKGLDAKALEYQIKAYELAKEIDYRHILAQSQGEIGNIYLDQNEYKKALEYFREGYQLFKKLDDKRQYAGFLEFIGSVYSKKKNYDSAEFYLNQSLVVREKLGIKTEIASSYKDLGSIAFQRENYAQALDYYQKAKRIHEEQKEKSRLAAILNDIGETYYQLSNFREAKKYSQEGLALSKETDSKDDIRDASKLLSELYQQAGDYKDAYEMHVLYKAMADSLISEEKTKELTRMQAELEFQQERDSISLAQEKERLSYELEIEENKRIQHLTLLGLILALVIGAILYRFYLSKQKANKVLVLMNEKVIDQKEELSKQAEELKTTNNKLVELDNFKGAMTGMIVHDLKNPLGVIINRSESDEVIKSNSQNMLNLVLNILDVQKFEEAKMSVVKETTQLVLIFEKAVEQVAYWVKEKNISLQIKANEQMYVEVDFELILRVIINLLNNAVKYTPNNGKITISANTESDFVKIEITDNGIGIPNNQLKTIFEKYRQVNAKSVGNVRSSGIGLTFCKMAIEAHDSKIGVKSSINIGTSFYFSLPLVTQVDDRIDDPKEVLISEEIFLDKEDQSYLNTVYKFLVAEDVYNYSAVSALLNDIKPTESTNVKKWIERTEDALLSQNQELFKSLVEMIKN